MSNINGWITDRLPNATDSDLATANVWAWWGKYATQAHYSLIKKGQPWQQIIAPKPYEEGESLPAPVNELLNRIEALEAKVNRINSLFKNNNDDRSFYSTY